MFEQVREMIDSTIYTNGKGEVTAQNVNLAFHGVIDAAEQLGQEIDNTNINVTELNNKLEEIGDSGLGGLMFKVPGFAIEDLEPNSSNEIVFDRESANIILEEYPHLAEPIDALFKHNAKAYQTYKEAVDNGEGTPVVTFEMSALYNEMFPSEGYAVNMVWLPIMVQRVSSGLEDMMICTLELEGTSDIVGLLPGGEVVFKLGFAPATIKVPMPDADAIDNSSEVFYLQNQFPSDYFKNEFQYVKSTESSSDNEPITPVHAEITKLNIFFRFVIGADVVEAIFNKETGLTRSRVIATMTPADVEQVLEGAVDISNPIISADTTVFDIRVYSNTPWLLYLDDVEMLSGEASNAYLSYSINVTKNTEATSRQLQLKLVSANSAEVLDTKYVTQEAAVATVEDEQTTE